MDLIVTLAIASFFGVILVFALKKGSSPSHQCQCPNCGQTLPAVRKPTNTRQMMWGGWTCTRCDAELDRSARVIKEGRPASAILAGGLDQADRSTGQGDLTESVSSGTLDLHDEDVALDFEQDASHQEDAEVSSSRRS